MDLFQVHYIFKNRSVCPVHICPNPYVHSLVLDSLCSSVSRALLRSIAHTYGATLRCLAFILSVWEPLVPFSDLDDLANNFEASFLFSWSQVELIKVEDSLNQLSCEGLWVLKDEGNRVSLD